MKLSTASINAEIDANLARLEEQLPVKSDRLFVRVRKLSTENCWIITAGVNYSSRTALITVRELGDTEYIVETSYSGLILDTALYNAEYFLSILPNKISKVF